MISLTCRMWLRKWYRGFPGSPWLRPIPMQETWVHFLVRKLRSHLLHRVHSMGGTKKKERRYKMRRKKIQTNFFTKQTHRHRKQIYGYLRGRGRRDTLGIQDSRHTTVHKTDKRALSCSAGNYSQCLILTYDGKASEREHLHAHACIHVHL